MKLTVAVLFLAVLALAQTKLPARGQMPVTPATVSSDPDRRIAG